MKKCQLKVKCPSFGADGQIPKKHTGFAEDISPEILIDGFMNTVKSVAIIMDDLDVPLKKELNHWLIWNIPVTSKIPENIPYGAECANGTKQGVGYGKNRYRGPKQPPFMKAAHRYRFTVYGLDCFLDLPTTSRKADLIKAMSGHVLQNGEVIGWYKP
ncbi:MAG: YbhB/YbcL family Raf kinase inhibitor-like protein [Lachnospiraceae bacterium]|nr:YbhB/YbcL family Raf kinase inhibitor-like protein [Lachnospiraceae bacterium]